jgi:hypothetical protein
VNPLYSTSNHLQAGSYAQAASSTLTGANAEDYSFAGYTTPTANYTVSPLALTGAAIAARSSTYGSAVTPGTVTFGNVVAGDIVNSAASIVSPTYSTSHNLAAGSYAQTASTLSGADAGDYSLAGFTTATKGYTVAPLALTVTGVTANNKVYNGSTADPLGGTARIAPISGDVVTLGGTGSGSFANANVGTSKPVTVSGYTLSGADAGDYLLVEPNGLSANISQLASVAWVGGASGNWSTASNWAGGAIPDYANVAAVTIPAGATVTYDSGVPGTTTLGTLTSSGNLKMAAGSLTTSGNVSTAGYQQSGGQLDVGGNLSIHSVNGGVTLGNIVAGSLSVGSAVGAITQLPSTAVGVAGATTLTARNGGACDANYGITLNNTGNDFVGAVSSNGSNISLADSAAGGLILGATTANGNLTATSLAGPLTQTAATAVKVTGATSLTASNGLSGASAVNYGITLNNTNNAFVGAVSSNGSNISLADSSSGGLILGNTTATGTLAAASSGGAITQVASTAVDAAGTSSLTAGNVASGFFWPLNDNITLANAGNDFVGAVTSKGSNISLTDNSAGGLTLGNTTATGKFTATASGGAITQAASTAVAVNGTTSLTAGNGVGGAGATAYNVTLAQAGNKLRGAVSAKGSAITLNDANSMTANVNSKGATSLTAAGFLTVGGTVGTTLTTVTTGGPFSATIFDPTTVGTSLNVTSTGPVITDLPGVLLVDGAATLTPNSHVTVNGKVGAPIY